MTDRIFYVIEAAGWLFLALLAYLLMAVHVMEQAVVAVGRKLPCALQRQSERKAERA